MSERRHQRDTLPWNSSGIARIRHWLRTVLGLDRAVGFTVLARFWSSAAGLVTVFLIARFLSLAEQGYYYTFGSLVAIQMIFELGFSFVILQMASHQRAQVSISADYEITGNPIAHARLASVIQKSVRWYSVAAVLLAATLLPVGIHFFSAHQHEGSTVFWRFPWCLAALMAALNFQIDPFLSFLEGCGYVSRSCPSSLYAICYRKPSCMGCSGEPSWSIRTFHDAPWNGFQRSDMAAGQAQTLARLAEIPRGQRSDSLD